MTASSVTVPTTTTSNLATDEVEDRHYQGVKVFGGGEGVVNELNIDPETGAASARLRGSYVHSTEPPVTLPLTIPVYAQWNSSRAAGGLDPVDGTLVIGFDASVGLPIEPAGALLSVASATAGSLPPTIDDIPDPGDFSEPEPIPGPVCFALPVGPEGVAGLEPLWLRVEAVTDPGSGVSASFVTYFYFSESLYDGPATPAASFDLYVVTADDPANTLLLTVEGPSGGASEEGPIVTGTLETSAVSQTTSESIVVSGPAGAPIPVVLATKTSSANVIACDSTSNPDSNPRANTPGTFELTVKRTDEGADPADKVVVRINGGSGTTQFELEAGESFTMTSSPLAPYNAIFDAWAEGAGTFRFLETFLLPE